MKINAQKIITKDTNVDKTSGAVYIFFDHSSHLLSFGKHFVNSVCV